MFAQRPVPVVFGYYFIATSTYGYLQTDYRRDIIDARAIGLDGFAIGLGAWGTELQYKTWVAAMFAAALARGDDFKLCFASEVGNGVDGLTSADVIDMVNTYKGHPNYYHYAGKPFLTTNAGERAGSAFWNAVFAETGPLAFYPSFEPAAVITNQPTYDETKVAWTSNVWWQRLTDGLAYFTYGGLIGNLLAAEEGKAQVMREYSRLYCGGLSAYYCQTIYRTPYMTTYEMCGGEGLAAQWQSMLNVQKPQLVILYTWSDCGESYISPALPSEMDRSGEGSWPPFHPHIGFAELNRYFIAWFKGNASPPIVRDELFYFYRIQPAALAPAARRIADISWSRGTATVRFSVAHNYLPGTAVFGTIEGMAPAGYNGATTLQAIDATTMSYPLAANPGAVTVAGNFTSNPSMTLNGLVDNICITTLLTVRGTIRLINGGVTTDHNVPSGLAHSRLPFVPGTVQIQLLRAGELLIDLAGERIVGTAFNLDHNPTTGYGAYP